MAMSRELVTSAAVCELPMDQPARHALGARATERARAEEVFSAVSDRPRASTRRAHPPIGSPLEGWRKSVGCSSVGNALR
jgi:hypothetical protein